MKTSLFDRILKKSFVLLPKNTSDFRHFSFIVDGRKIVSWGINHEGKTHTLAAKYNPRWGMIHSETDAIIRFPYKNEELKNYALYNVRIGKSGRILMSRPCRNCVKLLLDFNITKVFYTNEFGKLERMVI